jgi:hypothetical protein
MVNTLMTKDLILSRGKLRRNVPEFIYGEGRLEVVDQYLYLGVVFNYNGSFQKAITHSY